MIQIKSMVLGWRLASVSTVMLLFVGLLSAGCASITYSPMVTLAKSPQTIKATAKIELMVDQSPPSDKATQAMGLSACEPGTLQGDLPTAVTNAIMTDFDNNQVFATVKKRFDTTPDLIIKGTIVRFYGKFKPTAVMWCTIPIDIIWYFGVPILKDDGTVELTMSIERPDGTVLGTYRGESKFSHNYNMYQNAGLALPKRLNDAFSDAITQIRGQILKDEAKFTRGLAAASK